MFLMLNGKGKCGEGFGLIGPHLDCSYTGNGNFLERDAEKRILATKTTPDCSANA